jgi:hypothetical protein
MNGRYRAAGYPSCLVAPGELAVEHPRRFPQIGGIGMRHSIATLYG